MGTNYYLHRNVCPHCLRPEEKLHIGKSSGGWCFALHVDAERNINSLDDWKKLFDGEDNGIVNEYGDPLTAPEMLEVITDRKAYAGKPLPEKFPDDDYFYPGWTKQRYLDSNHAEEGPLGLLRAKIDGRHCVGHGEGTWDCIQGEFS